MKFFLSWIYFFSWIFPSQAYEINQSLYNKASTRRLVKDQLIAISDNYFKLYTVSTPKIVHDLVDNHSVFTDLITLQVKLQHQCTASFQTEVCQPLLRQLLEKSNLEKYFDSIFNRTIKEARQVSENQLIITSLMIAYRDIDQLRSLLLRYPLNPSLNYQRLVLQEIMPQLGKVKRSVQSLYLSSLDPLMGSAYQKFWDVFLMPALSFIHFEENYPKFQHNMEHLDRNLNNFVHFCKKYEKQLPKLHFQYCQQMQMRWNYILKNTLLH